MLNQLNLIYCKEDFFERFKYNPREDVYNQLITQLKNDCILEKSLR